MTPTEKQGPGIPLAGELTRKEYDILMLIAKKLKHEKNPWNVVRWLIEAYGTGRLPYSEEGAEVRSLLRGLGAEVHYPDSVSVSMSPAVDKE